MNQSPLCSDEPHVPVHIMTPEVVVRLIPVGAGSWRFNENGKGVMEISWVPKNPPSKS